MTPLCYCQGEQKQGEGSEQKMLWSKVEQILVSPSCQLGTVLSILRKNEWCRLCHLEVRQRGDELLAHNHTTEHRRATSERGRILACVVPKLGNGSLKSVWFSEEYTGGCWVACYNVKDHRKMDEEIIFISSKWLIHRRERGPWSKQPKLNQQCWFSKFQRTTQIEPKPLNSACCLADGAWVWLNSKVPNTVCFR